MGDKAQRARRLSGTTLPLVRGEAWSDAAIEDIEAMDADADGLGRAAKPLRESQWREADREVVEGGGALLERIGRPTRSSGIALVSAGDKPAPGPSSGGPSGSRTRTCHTGQERRYSEGTRLVVRRGGRRRGRASSDSAGALGVSEGAAGGSPWVGNACVWALGNMPGTEGIGQLSLLKARIKVGKAQKGIEQALCRGMVGLPREEIEEMSVPAYGCKRSEYGASRSASSVSSWSSPGRAPQKCVGQAGWQAGGTEGRQGASCRGVERAQGGCQGRTEDAGSAGQDREPYLEQKSWAFFDLARALPGPSARRHAGAASGLEVQ